MLKRTELESLSATDQQAAILKEIIKCKVDPIYCIENYCSIPDAETGEEILLKFYPYQLNAIDDYEDYNHNLSMKSRQMGFSTITAAYCAWDGITKNNRIINVLANKMLVSKKNLRMIRNMIDSMRKNTLYKDTSGKEKSWLVCDYMEDMNGKEQFGLKTGSIYTAEANNDSAGRSGTIHIYWIDEVAAIDKSSATRMGEIWASAGLTLAKSKGKCIGISTPVGMAGWYFDTYTNAEEKGWNIIKAHWSEHPDYSKGSYQWIIDESLPEGGYLKHFNLDWPKGNDRFTREQYKTKETYSYIKDGKLRSPWYDIESKKLGVQKTLCELDCSFAGSGGEVLSSETIKEHELKSSKTKRINEEGKGPWKYYKKYKEYIDDHEYVLTSDVMTGDGADYSSILVIDITAKELVATWKAQFDPIMLAEMIYKIAQEYKQPIAIVEYQGPGLTTLLELKNRWLYKNLFFTTLKKNDITKTAKRKIGFWQSSDTRRLGGDKLEEILNNSERLGWDLSKPDLLVELYTWIWDKDGKRRHAPGKHDDVIMALSNALYYIFYVKDKQAAARIGLQGITSRSFEAWGMANNNRLQDDTEELLMDF